MYNGKSLLIVPPDPTIFSDASKKGWSASCQGITGRFMVFTGEILVHKCSRIESSETSNSFFYAIQKTKYDSSKDKEHDSSLLFIKHGRNPEQTFNRNLKRNLELLHRKENTFDSSLSNQTADWASQNFQDSSELKLHSIDFKTNLQLFSETIIGPVCFQSLPPTATIHIAWQPEPQNVATDAFQQDWDY